MRYLLCIVMLLGAACGGDDDGAAPDGGATDASTARDGSAGSDAGPTPMRVDVEESSPGGTPIAPSTECTVTTWREPASARDHREPCSELAYPFHPPASGPHYGVWADFLRYDAPVPWGYLVHSLEHGAIVLAYDCPEGCDDVLAALDAIITDHGADPLCESHDGTDARFILVPDPDLEDGTIAAVAWEHAYVATCLDEPSLRTFVEEHYGGAPEDLCAAGLDDSASGWCE